MALIPGRLLRSAGLRFAVVYAVLLAVSTLSIASFLWWSTAGLINRQIEGAIEADAESLSEHWRRGGIPAAGVSRGERR